MEEFARAQAARAVVVDRERCEALLRERTVLEVEDDRRDAVAAVHAAADAFLPDPVALHALEAEPLRPPAPEDVPPPS